MREILRCAQDDIVEGSAMAAAGSTMVVVVTAHPTPVRPDVAAGSYNAVGSYRAAPPSTVIIDPVIISASSDTTNSIVLAMSSAVCMRPSGVKATRRA
jgi:hypothetical protein